jgi:hypothetical protein
MRTVLRFVVLLIVILVVVAAGATLKVDERCGGYRLGPAPNVSDEVGRSGSLCDWRIVWRY